MATQPLIVVSPYPMTRRCCSVYFGLYMLSKWFVVFNVQSLLFFCDFFFVVVGIEPRALGTTNLIPNSSFVKLSTIFHLMNYNGLLDHYPEISWVFSLTVSNGFLKILYKIESSATSFIYFFPI